MLKLKKNLKTIQRSQKDFKKKSLEDLPKKINVDLLKIFRRKSFYQIFIKSFLLKIFKQFSEEIQRRSSEE